MKEKNKEVIANSSVLGINLLTRAATGVSIANSADVT